MKRGWATALAGLVLLSACSLFDRRPEGERRRVIREDRLPPVARTEEGPRRRVLVLPFLDARPDRSTAFRSSAQVAFVRALNKTGQLIAVDSAELKKDVSGMVRDGEYNWKELAGPVKDLGVAALLEGKIMDLRVKRSSDAVGIVRNMTTTFEAVVRVRMASSRSAQEIFNTVKTVTLEKNDVRVAERVDSDRFIQDNPELLQTIVKDAFLDFLPDLTAAVGKLAWEGRIAAINGDRVYLNVGRVSGVQVGDLLKVAEEGEEVFDPESGSHIGRVPGRMKGTLEVISFFGVDGSIAVIHSGAGFKENDRVELYQ